MFSGSSLYSFNKDKTSNIFGLLPVIDFFNLSSEIFSFFFNF